MTDNETTEEQRPPEGPRDTPASEGGASGRDTDAEGAQKGLVRSMLVVSAGVLLSRVLGLVRDVGFASRWGTGTAFAAFSIAFMIPNLLRALFGEGAFSAAFVPTYSEKLEKQGPEHAWEAAQRVITALMVVLVLLVAAVVALAMVLRRFATQEIDLLTLQLLPWVMPYALLICATGAFSGVLNSLRHFLIPSLTPVVLNVTLITATLFVCPYWGSSSADQVQALALSVLLAGTVQLGLQLAACGRKGLRFRFDPDWRSAEVRRVAMLIVPALLGTGVTQLNAFVDKLLARILGSAAVGSLYYSQRLVYLPVGLFGVAMAVVCLPAMSRAWARQDRGEMRASLAYALRHVLFLTVPAAALLAVTGVDVVRLLFERGTFDASSTRETFWALAFYLPGIPAFACVKVAVTPFYARQDTKTPVKIASACLILNVILNLVLMCYLRQGGLALSTSICSYVNITLLLVLTSRAIGGVGARRLLMPFCRITVAAGLAALVARFVQTMLPEWRILPICVQLCLRVLLPLGAGGVAYIAATVISGCAEPRELVGGMLSRLSRRSRSASSGER